MVVMQPVRKTVRRNGKQNLKKRRKILMRILQSFDLFRSSVPMGSIKNVDNPFIGLP
jgi:hypothetical protein